MDTNIHSPPLSLQFVACLNGQNGLRARGQHQTVDLVPGRAEVEVNAAAQGAHLVGNKKEEERELVYFI